jgi:hypothetical protein
MNPLTQLKKATPLCHVVLALGYLALLPRVQAVSPAPDGGYPGGNTAEGQTALLSLTSGGFNTAVGYLALRSNMTGAFNTGLGAGTLLANTGDQNTATGAGALLSNTTGFQNTANGAFALFSNTTGGGNTATGRSALSNNTTGFQNIATGHTALINNTTGSNNTAHGYQALASNFTGNNNTAMGSNAGTSITGTGNVCIGQGVSGEGGVDDSTYIRNVNTLLQNFSAGVSDYVTVRLSDGRLGHTAVVSSQRYKQDIKPLAAASQALYALKPVSFRLKKEFDPTQTLGFGLIAEEVEKVDPALVYRNDKGQVESVRYEMVNAMLLNEFLKEHRKNEEQEATIAQLKREMETIVARLKEHDSKIQTVSAHIELSEAVAQTALNNP